MLENSFAEKRRKKVENREKALEEAGSNFSAPAAVDPGFRARRIAEVNRKKKIDSRYNPDMWDEIRTTGEFVRAYADWVKEREKRKEETQARAQGAKNLTDVRRAELEELEKHQKYKQGDLSSAYLQGRQVDSTALPAAASNQNRTMREIEEQQAEDAKKIRGAKKEKADDQRRKEKIGLVEHGIFKDSLEHVTPYEMLKYRPDFQVNMKDRDKNALEAYGRSEGHDVELMEQGEKDIYNYLYSRYGLKQADRYLETLDNELSARRAGKIRGFLQGIGEDHPFLEKAANTGISFVSGIGSAAEGVGRMGSLLTGRTEPSDINPNEYYMDALMQETGSGAEKNVYEIANSIGYMAPGAVIGGATGAAQAGSALFAAGVAGNTYDETIREGKDVRAAQAYALLSGASEGVTEWALGGIAGLSGGAAKKLLGNTAIAKAAAKGLTSLSKNEGTKFLLRQAGAMGADMASEGTQEYVQELLDKATRNMLFGEQNRLALDDPEAWHAAFLGALTAGVMNAPGEALYISDVKNHGKGINPDYRDYTGIFSEDRADFGTDQEYQEAQDLERLAREYAARQKEKGTVSDLEKAVFDMRLNEQYGRIAERANEEKEQEAAEPVEEQTGAEQEKIGQRQQTEASEAQQEAREPGQVETAAEVPEQVGELRPETNAEPESGASGAEVQESLTGRENGQETPDNARANAENVQFAAENGQVQEGNADWIADEDVRELGSQYGLNGKNAYMDNYDRETDLVQYSRAFERAYDAGRYGMKMNDAEHAAVMSVLDSRKIENAWKAGALDREQVRKAAAQFRTGAARTGGMADLSMNASAAQKTVAQYIGKRTGLQIELVDSIQEGAARGEYGNGKIRISVDNEDFAGSMSHELTHFIREYAPESYEYYADSVVKAMMKAKNVKLEELVETYQNKYSDAGQELTHDEIMEEIVADGAQDFLTDEEFIRGVAQADRTLGQKILDFINDVIESLRSMIRTGRASKSNAALKENMVLYERAARNWRGALDEAGAAYREGKTSTKGSGERYQLNQFGFEEYTDHEKENWANTNIFYCNSKKDIENFYQNHVHKKPYARLYMGKIGKELSDKIEADTGVRLEGFNVAISSEYEDSHNDARQESYQGMIAVDGKILSELPDIISNYDKVELSGTTRYHDKPAFKFTKDINGRRVAIEYVRTKKKMLELQTMYAWKDSSKKRVPTTLSMPESPTRTETSETYGSLPFEYSINSGIEKVNGENDTFVRDENGDRIRFQLGDESFYAEETDDKNLIAVHNLTEEKLLKTLQYEGIPMPSIAVTRYDLGHENFGGISLLFKKDTIDPKRKKNKVYGADAWTPTFPKIEYEADDDVIGNFRQIVRNLKGKLPEEYAHGVEMLAGNLEGYLNAYEGESGVIRNLKDKTEMKALYLADRGESVQEIKKEVREEKRKNERMDAVLSVFEEDIDTVAKTRLSVLYDKYRDRIRETLVNAGVEEEQADRMTEKNGRLFGFSKLIQRAVDYAQKPDYTVNEVTDYAAMQKDIDSRINEREYETWLQELIGGLEKGSGVWNGKELFKPSGERRTFKQTHLEANAKNIVKSMLAQGEDAKNVAGFHGVKSIRTIVTDEFKSIREMKDASGRLQDIGTEEYNALIEGMENRLYAVMGDIIAKKVGGYDPLAINNLGEGILEAVENPTADNIKQVLEGYRWAVTDSQAKELEQIAEDIYNMPVDMFEAKPQRVVGFDEIAAAVVPDNADPRVLDALEEKGIRAIEYDHEDENARGVAVRSVKDIRFQLEDADLYADDSYVQSLLQENQELKEANELLKKQFELTANEEMRKSDIHRVSVDITKKYGSKASTKKLDERITKLYEYIRSGENMDWDEVSELATGIGRTILNQAAVEDPGITDVQKDIRRQIRNTKITISDQDKADLASEGGYNGFRKHYMGSLRLGQGGIQVDSFYQELAEQHPDQFDAAVSHPADQLVKIAEFMDLTKPRVENPYHADMDEMAYHVGQELLAEYQNVRSTPTTFADRKAAELERLKKSYQKKLDEYKNTTEAEYKALLGAARQENRNTEQTAQAELKAQRAKYDQRMRDQRENRRKREAINKTIREVNRLSKWLLKPTDEKHIPEKLRTTVAAFLADIDFSSKESDNTPPTKRTESWAQLKNLCERIMKAGGLLTDSRDSSVYVDLEPGITVRIEEAGSKVSAVQKLEDLDAYTIEQILMIVRSVKTTLNDINMLKSNEAWNKAGNAVKSILEETEGMKKNRGFSGALGESLALVNVEMLDPQTMFGKMGPTMKMTYDSLRRGLDRKTELLSRAQQYFDGELEKSGIKRADIRRWTGVNAPTTTFQVAGGTVELSIPQVMSLYELNKRAQARKHLYSRVGGIEADDLRIGTSWDSRKIGVPRVKTQNEARRVTEADVKRITDTLTPEQKRFADALQKFLGTETSDWGNETSMNMYGYKKFTARDYFPIVVDKNSLMRVEKGKEDTVIKNLGMVKETNPNANNPIVIEDILEVFTRQVDQMSSYNAYVAPLSDLHKILNYQYYGGKEKVNIRDRLTEIFGKAGEEYIENLIRDLNGSVVPERSTGIFNMLLSNQKAASVAGNLRVAIQQPTAIARAYAEIDAKYLAAGVVKGGQQWELITKYAPIAQWKDWGFYQMQTSRQMKDVLTGSDSAKQRLVNRTMVLAELGDKVTWKRIWNAAELETRDHHPDLKEGSEEFYKVVGRRFSDIIDRTQVADSVLHRSQIMRSKNGAAKMATAFMAEPTKTYNMLYRAMWDAKNSGIKKAGETEKERNARLEKQKTANKRLLRASAAYAASTFLTALAASVMDTVRDDDREKDFGGKYWDNFIANMWEGIVLLNNIPYIKDILALRKGFTPKRSEMQGFQDIAYAVNKVQKAAKGEGKYTPQYVFLEAARSTSALFGIPIKSVTRDALAVIDTAMHAAGGTADHTWLKGTYDISHKENRKLYVKEMMQAEDEGNAKLYKVIRNDLLTKGGMSEDDIDQKINEILNDRLDDMGIDIPAAAEALDPGKKESINEFQRQVQTYIEVKARAGWDKEKCLQTIRTSLTNEFKPKWKAAKTQKERDDVIRQCNRLIYKGKPLYSGYDFSKWRD